MPTQFFKNLLVPLGASVSTAGSIQTGGNLQDVYKIPAVDPASEHVQPHDESDRQPAFYSDVVGGVS